MSNHVKNVTKNVDSKGSVIHIHVLLHIKCTINPEVYFDIQIMDLFAKRENRFLKIIL